MCENGVIWPTFVLIATQFSTYSSVPNPCRRIAVSWKASAAVAA